MPKEEINLSIPQEKQISVILDMLIENNATICALQDFLFFKIMNITNSDLSKEKLLDMSDDFIKSQKQYIERLRPEIIANLMSKYSE